MRKPFTRKINRLAHALFAEREMVALGTDSHAHPTLADIYLYAGQNLECSSKTERHTTSMVTIVISMDYRRFHYTTVE